MHNGSCDPFEKQNHFISNLLGGARIQLDSHCIDLCQYYLPLFPLQNLHVTCLDYCKRKCIN